MSTEPTETQLTNCLLMGWMHAGDGFFTKGDYIGWFEQRNFIKVYAPDRKHHLQAEKPHTEQSGLNDLGQGGVSIPVSGSAP